MTTKNRIIRAIVRWAWTRHPERVREVLSETETHVHRNPPKGRKRAIWKDGHVASLAPVEIVTSDGLREAEAYPAKGE